VTAAVFRARDAHQRRHLLTNLDQALTLDRTTELVAACAYEGPETSLYLWSFYDVGWSEGYRAGYGNGREAAFDHVYGSSARDVVARTKARKSRRPTKRGKKAKR
jgi:hypothetical protein